MRNVLQMLMVCLTSYYSRCEVGLQTSNTIVLKAEFWTVGDLIWSLCKWLFLWILQKDSVPFLRNSWEAQLGPSVQNHVNGPNVSEKCCLGHPWHVPYGWTFFVGFPEKMRMLCQYWMYDCIGVCLLFLPAGNFESVGQLPPRVAEQERG